MAKKARAFSMGAVEIDSDSFAVTIDFDGFNDPGAMAALFNTICPEGTEVTLGHVGAALAAMWRENQGRKK